MSLREIFYTAPFGVGRGVKTRVEEDGIDTTTDEWEAADTIEDVAENPITAEELAQSSTGVGDIARSTAAMDAVSASQTAMDAVSASSTARDAIGTSGVGYDAIAAVAMAIGKYAAGIAGLDATTYADIDAVASDSAAMDAVSTSSTAVSSVAGSPLGLSKFFTSTHLTNTFWPNSTASTFWQYNNAVTVNNGDNQYGGPALFLPVGTSDVASWDIDLDQLSQISVTDRATDFRSSDNEFQVRLGGDTLYSTNNNYSSYQTNSFDVSAESGTQTLELLISGSSTDAEGDTLVSDITTTA